MSQDSYKIELYKLWDDYSVSDGDQEQKIAIAIQKYIANLNARDAEDYYFWGNSVYSLNQARALEISHPLFRKALDIDKGYYLARLYSAHCYHDKGEYKEALEEYLLVNQVDFEKEMPIWRTVKLNEQIGYCYAKLNQLDVAEQYFRKVVSSYITVENCELVPVQEAYECLPADHPLVSELKKAEEIHFT